MSGNHWTCRITDSQDVSGVTTRWNDMGSSAEIMMEFEQGIRVKATITNDTDSPAEDDGGDTIAITDANPGDLVGFAQTLVKSTRQVAFEGGGTFDVIPRAGVPCLDASQDMEEENRPFYNPACRKELPAPGEDCDLDFQDAPDSTVPIRAKDSEGEKNFASYIQDEEFVLALVVQRQGESEPTVLRQWKWSFKVEATEDQIRGQSAVFTPGPREVVSGETMVWTGEIATVNQQYVWSDGYRAHDWTPEYEAK